MSERVSHTRPLTVAVCTPRFAPQVGGAETWLRAVLAGLTLRDHRVIVLAAAWPGIASSTTVDGIEVRRAAPGRLTFARHVTSSVRALRPDVVVSQYSATPAATWAAGRTGMASVAIVHD